MILTILQLGLIAFYWNMYKNPIVSQAMGGDGLFFI